MKPLVIVKLKSLTQGEIRKIESAGYLVIQALPKDIIFRPCDTEMEQTNCTKCKEPIFLTHERHEYLKNSSDTFFCSHWHTQSYAKIL